MSYEWMMKIFFGLLSDALGIIVRIRMFRIIGFAG
jgi:hypothetical protein